MNLKLTVGKEEVELDPSLMNFTEASLNDYLMKDASLYSFYHQKWVDAQYLLNLHEDQHEALYARRFQECKEAGATDKLAEAIAKASSDVQEAKEKARNAKHIRDHLWGWLKSLDKAHENALNLGYNVRKEMQVLHHQHVKELDAIMG